MHNSDLYIIVQAGGRGSRLRHHTWNKPKCLVSVRGKPILYHLFNSFVHAKFIIIGDYLFDQLEKYLKVNSPGVSYQLIKTNHKGTAAGIDDALKLVPKDSPMLLTWSDLILGNVPVFPTEEKPVVAITDSFTCRWTLSSSGYLHESPASENGIPGLFYFSRSELLPSPPQEGEFVKWFSKNVYNFSTYKINDLEELGDFSSIETDNDRSGFCRFFNQVVIDDENKKVTKSVIDHNYLDVHANEILWYKEAEKLGYRRIPKIYSKNPLIMEKIPGIHAYNAHDFSEREKRAVLSDFLDSLIALHDLDKKPAKDKDTHSVYIEKTISRVQSISSMIPMFDRETVTVNGRKCRNIFTPKYFYLFEDIYNSLKTDVFTPIHGDPTFSNSLVDNNLRVWLIDPRGSFASSGIFGDPWYDFAKVYYSAVGGYDAFNRRKFKLHIDNDTVEVLLESPFFEKTARQIFNDYFGKDIKRIQILHGLIWLSLSGYAKDDIDSIIGSFFLGLYWLEEGM